MKICLLLCAFVGIFMGLISGLKNTGLYALLSMYSAGYLSMLVVWMLSKWWNNLDE